MQLVMQIVVNLPYKIHQLFVDACAFYLVPNIQRRTLCLIRYMLEILELQFHLCLPLRRILLACIESKKIRNDLWSRLIGIDENKCFTLVEYEFFGMDQTRDN